MPDYDEIYLSCNLETLPFRLVLLGDQKRGAIF
jgi:hypothetical protein